MKSERRVCPVDEEGRFSLTLSDVDNGDHYFRAYMVIDGKTYNGVTGWFEVKVASVPEVTTELSEAAGGVLTLKGSYKLDRDLSVEPGVPLRRDRGWRRLRTVRTGYASRRSEQKTFSLDIPDTGQPCFFQAVVRMSTRLLRRRSERGDPPEAIFRRRASQTATSSPKAAGTASNPNVPTELPSKGLPPTGYGRQVPDLYRACTSRRAASSSRPAGTPEMPESHSQTMLARSFGAGTSGWPRPPAEQTVNGRTFLDRNVGATEFDGALVGSLGVYFQWGRKDPFIGANRIQKNYTDEYEGVGFQTTGDNGFTALFLYNDALCEGFKFVNKEMDMSMSIANPTVFYGVYNSGGWKGSNSEVEDYWGGASGTKTNNDPCPAGYRVPTFDEINGFIKDIDTNKTAQENVSDQSYGRKYTVGDQTFMFRARPCAYGAPRCATRGA